MTDVAPCPMCHKNNKLGLKSGITPNSLVIECENCEYTMFLESHLPIEPEKILNEWNSRVKKWDPNIDSTVLCPFCSVRFHRDQNAGFIVDCPTCGARLQINDIGGRL